MSIVRVSFISYILFALMALLNMGCSSSTAANGDEDSNDDTKAHADSDSEGGSDDDDDSDSVSDTDTDSDSGGTCSRTQLEDITQKLREAIEAGNPEILPLAADLFYTLDGNQGTLAAGSGIWAFGTAVDAHLDVIDTKQCKTYSELIGASWSTPHVMGFAMTINNTSGEIVDIYEISANADNGWAFGADGYIAAIANQDWGTVAEAERLDRDDLESGARAYFEFFKDKDYDVPWGDPCSRLEGGKSAAVDNALRTTFNPDETALEWWGSCSVGCPVMNFPIPVADAIIDESINAVALVVQFCAADIHMFHFLKDINPTWGYGIRHIHTISVDCM